ncbi:UbiA prenyltransferase family protein [Actinomadura kijaniata]|uniref:UbiA prenyltransferase family protein n=1 Tax=Actinomadura kijaniata TaxID=46161 RepID=UPI000829C2E3|nr:UbiA prenyltransferase family protein [Actinomadura kijaniata]
MTTVANDEQVAASPSNRDRARTLLSLLRPAQWFKNLVVAVPLVLVGDGWEWSRLAAVLFGVFLFTCAASATYVVNDIADHRRDRSHPVKRGRPIASGAVGVRRAVAVAALVYAVTAAAIAVRPMALAVPVVLYIALNLLYSTVLKHVALVDVFMLASGFALRVACGSLAVGDRPSPWLLICVLSASLLLGLGKRRREMGDGAVADLGALLHRPALSGYSRQLIDSLVAVTGAVAVVGYVAYLSVEVTGRPVGWFTVMASTPLVMFGLARYLQVLIVGEGGGDPARTLVTDRPLLVVGALWSLCFVLPPLVA